MRYWLYHHIYVLYGLILVIYLVNVFIGSESITYLIGILTVPMLLLSFLGASRLFKTLGALFIFVGSLLFLRSGLPLKEGLIFFTTNLGLIALLATLPWMNSVVRAGRFDRRINELMKANVAHMGKLYVRSSITTYTLVSFINLSALTLTQGVILENLSKMSKKLRDTFISRTTLRAFSMALVWSPMEVLVAISVDATGVGYLAMLPWLILISVITMVLDNLWGYRVYSSIPYELPIERAPRSLSIKQIVLRVVHLFFALVLFLILIVTIGNIFTLNFTLTVTLVIIPFACVWSFMMKRWRSFLAIGWKTWKLRTNGMQNFVVLFVSLAFFSNSLNATPLLSVIQDPFLSLSEYPLLILLFIQVTYLLMSMIGIHPVATIGVLMEVVTPLYGIMNPLGIGIAFITGALATASVGTYGVTVTMTSMNTRQNPYRITLRNMPFAIVYGLIGTFVAYLAIL